MKDLIFQNGTSSETNHGGLRKDPRVFTEHGVVMVATLLKSDKAIAASQFIVRVFVDARRAQGQVDRANAQVPVAMDQVAASDPGGLRGKIHGMIDRILDQIADPIERARGLRTMKQKREDMAPMAESGRLAEEVNKQLGLVV